MSELFSIFIGIALVNNIVLVKFLGLCPVFGASKSLRSAVSMGLAVSLVMFISSVIAWLVTNYILIPFDAEYMNIVIYVLIIAALVQLVELFIKKTDYTLFNAFGIYLALITTNCAVLGIILINNSEEYSLLQSLVSAAGAGFGFMIVLAIMSGIRERLELADCPKVFKGLPLTFITATILSLSFVAFAGMV